MVELKAKLATECQLHSSLEANLQRSSNSWFCQPSVGTWFRCLHQSNQSGSPNLAARGTTGSRVVELKAKLATECQLHSSLEANLQRSSNSWFCQPSVGTWFRCLHQSNQSGSPNLAARGTTGSRVVELKAKLAH